MDMKFFYLSFCVISSSQLFAHAMHGGEPYPIEKAPYMAVVYASDKNYTYGPCGGAILSERWILTAAHCMRMHDELNIEYMEILAGANESDEYDKLHNSSRFIRHSKYSVETRWNDDIGLIKLADPLVFNNTIQPISISKRPPKVGEVVTITGYGMDHDTALSQLHMGHQRVIDRGACRKAYKGARQGKVRIGQKVFCTDSTAVDAGHGDSGSPVVMNGKIIGIVVEGGETPLPNIYVNIVHYYDWITLHTGIDFDEDYSEKTEHRCFNDLIWSSSNSNEELSIILTTLFNC